MFTGIIQDIGKIESAVKRGGNLVLRVSSEKLSPALRIGSSVNINGACQTVTEIQKNNFAVEAISETLHLSSIPGMVESIKAGMKEKVEDCSEDLDW